MPAPPPPTSPGILIAKINYKRLFGLTAENRRPSILNKKRLIIMPKIAEPKGTVVMTVVNLEAIFQTEAELIYLFIPSHLRC